MTASHEDVPRIAAVLRTAGELWEAHGALVLSVTKDWQRGLRSQSFDAGTGGGLVRCTDPTCDECPAPAAGDPKMREHWHPRRTGDPTGESAGEPDDKASLLHREVQARLDRIASDAAWLRDVVSALVPPANLVVPEPVDWCTNHLRINKCEPRYRGDLCEWCYKFNLEWRRTPPPALMGVKHQFGRVTERQVKDSLKAEGELDKTLKRVNDSIRAARRVG